MEGMIGEVRMFGGNFAPRAWAFCDGQLLAISTHTALFSILGTTYGGDGRTTFALPDLRGRVAIGPGNGPGLPDYRLGQKGGSETNTLNVTQIPSHNHSAAGTLKVATSTPGNTNNPEGNYYALASGRDSGNGQGVQVNMFESAANGNGAANAVNVTMGNTGGNQPVNDMQPYSVVNYVICMQGVFPSRG